MKEFEPSRDFVSRVMKDIFVYERRQEQEYSRSQRFLASPIVRYVMSAAGVLLGLFNLARLYFSLLSPVACR